jgi:hypothetical protein
MLIYLLFVYFFTNFTIDFERQLIYLTYTLQSRRNPKAFIEFTLLQSFVIRTPRGWIRPGSGNVQQLMTLIACVPFLIIQDEISA